MCKALHSLGISWYVASMDSHCEMRDLQIFVTTTWAGFDRNVASDLIWFTILGLSMTSFWGKTSYVVLKQRWLTAYLGYQPKELLYELGR